MYSHNENIPLTRSHIYLNFFTYYSKLFFINLPPSRDPYTTGGKAGGGESTTDILLTSTIANPPLISVK